MRKIKEKLLLVITSLMCLTILFGCISINSKAASNEAVNDLRFEGDHIHFKTISEEILFQNPYL